MKILQINASVNTGSTGRITEDIGKVFISNDIESFIAYGRKAEQSKSTLFRIGTNLDIVLHGVRTAILDDHAFGSKNATKKLIQWIEAEKPDAIGLHNLHGYYINVELLFNYLSLAKIPVIWTLFDCWSFTGHCSYFDDINCTKWEHQCYSCPKYKKYPSSYLLDNSISNFKRKKSLFTSVSNLHLIVHSEWLKSLVTKSFLRNISISKINNGIDLQTFFPQNNFNSILERYKLSGNKIILGVANIWIMRKGLSDFLKLSEMIDSDTKILLVGLTTKQIKKLPQNVIGIMRTESIHELATFYSMAAVFVNPTYMDNFPTTNLEALACGTPVITYNTGGSPEAIDNQTGIVVEKGNVTELLSAINTVLNNGKKQYSTYCRQRAQLLFNKDDRYNEYLALYQKLVN